MMVQPSPAAACLLHFITAAVTVCPNFQSQGSVGAVKYADCGWMGDLVVL